MGNKLKVLIIEDNKDDINIMKEMFQEISLKMTSDTKYKLFVANTIVEVESILDKFSPDIVLVDLNLPDSNGEETLEKIKDKTSNQIPFIILTGIDDNIIASKALHLGFQDYLIKDKLTSDSLYRSIMYSIERFKLHNELLNSKRELESFAYTLAHDLKQPLNSAIMACNLIKKINFSKLSIEMQNDLKSFLNKSEKNLYSMVDIIDKLYYYCTADNKFNTFNVISLEKCVEDAIDNLKSIIKNNDVIIEYRNLPNIQGDKVLITLLMQNLLNNSIKYRKDDRPNIKIKTEEIKDKIIIQIEDNGLGIEKEHLKTIFNPFHRATKKKDPSGFGIGLATCKKIIDLHQGEIWAKSDIGEGSIFYISLPK